MWEAGEEWGCGRYRYWERIAQDGSHDCCRDILARAGWGGGPGWPQQHRAFHAY